MLIMASKRAPKAVTSQSTPSFCLLRLLSTFSKQILATLQVKAFFAQKHLRRVFRKKLSEMNELDLWFESAKKGDVETLCQLLEDNKITDVDVQDSNHHTALYLAAKRGKESCVTALLDLGADPNR